MEVNLTPMSSGFDCLYLLIYMYPSLFTNLPCSHGQHFYSCWKLRPNTCVKFGAIPILSLILNFHLMHRDPNFTCFLCIPEIHFFGMPVRNAKHPL